MQVACAAAQFDNDDAQAAIDATGDGIKLLPSTSSDRNGDRYLTILKYTSQSVRVKQKSGRNQPIKISAHSSQSTTPTLNSELDVTRVYKPCDVTTLFQSRY